MILNDIYRPEHSTEAPSILCPFDFFLVKQPFIVDFFLPLQSQNTTITFMKYSEFIRLVERSGWIRLRQSGNHIIYSKDGKIYLVPNHGSKEIGKGLEQKMRKAMGLK